MFIMKNPKEIIPSLFERIKKFGDMAGFYINKTKTKIMCKNMQIRKQKELEYLTGCEVTNKVKYLEINLTMKNLDLFKNIYEVI